MTQPFPLVEMAVKELIETRYPAAAGKVGATRFDINITGVRATATAAGKTGTLSADCKITGSRATASAAGRIGSPKVARPASAKNCEKS